MTHRPPSILTWQGSSDPLDDTVSGQVYPRLHSLPCHTDQRLSPRVRHQILHRRSQPSHVHKVRKWAHILSISLVGSSLWGIAVQRPAIAQSTANPDSITTASVAIHGDGIVPSMNRGLPQQKYRHKQTEELSTQSSGDLASFSQSKPSRWGRPYTGNGTSTDARSGCAAGSEDPLVALVPDVNFGRSLSSHPTLWFYVPDSSLLTAGSFVLVDEDHNDVLPPLEFTLGNTPGFVGVRLPKSASSIETNKSYHWYFELYCDDSSSAVSVDGWIERTTPAEWGTDDASTVSEQWSDQAIESPNLQTYDFYRNHFIWFDAFDFMFQEWSETHTDAAKEELLSLMQSANVALNAWPMDASVIQISYD